MIFIKDGKCQSKIWGIMYIICYTFCCALHPVAIILIAMLSYICSGGNLSKGVDSCLELFFTYRLTDVAIHA